MQAAFVLCHRLDVTFQKKSFVEHKDKLCTRWLMRRTTAKAGNFTTNRDMQTQFSRQSLSRILSILSILLLPQNTVHSPTYLSAVEHLCAGDVDKADHVTAVFDVVGHAEPPGGVPLQVVVVEEPANLRQRRRRRRTAQRHRRALLVDEALLEGLCEDGRTVAQLQLARRLAGLLLRLDDALVAT